MTSLSTSLKSFPRIPLGPLLNLVSQNTIQDQLAAKEIGKCGFLSGCIATLKKKKKEKSMPY